MNEGASTPEDERTVYHQPNWNVGTVNQTVVVQPGPISAELTPEQLAAAESRYRAQVVERYNRLGFAGLGISGSNLSELPLDDVFVRLTLTVEKTVHEPIPPEEWAREREEPSNRFFRRGVKKEDDRPRERIVTVQEPITLGDALAQHALIVGEPGAGKSTLLRWLAVIFAAGSQREANRLGPQADADRLPLLVELGKLPQKYLQVEGNEKPFWPDLIPEEVLSQGKREHQKEWDGVPATFLKQALAEGRCLILCDGLDEIADLNVRGRIQSSLSTYADTKYPNGKMNRLVLSSRPAGVTDREGVLTIQRFTPEEVRRFFGFLYAQYKKSEKYADALYDAVQAKPKTLELATTPLLAALLFALWNKNQTLPRRRVELYERCCQMLIESWEAQHDVAYTGVLAEIGWERHLRLLAPLAYAIHNTGQRTDAPASELIPVLAQAMQTEGLAPPASATLEAEKFLRTLSLRSGLLQFLGTDEKGQGRYGFPHLTFQEYLTARHIAAQPDPDYIDLVMVHLHKAWWREVHLLVIGHLGSGREGVEKVSRLLDLILNLYRAPWQVLRSQRFNRWIPRWLREFVNNYREYRILQLPIYGFGIVVVLVSVPFLLAGNFLATRVRWQLERRLAWILAREFSFTVTGFFDFSPLDVDARFCNDLANDARRLLFQIILDPGRVEDFNSAGLLRHAAAGTLRELGQVSEQVVSVLVDELLNSDLDARCVAADSLGLLGQASEDVVSALVQNLGESEWFVRQAAAGSLRSLGQASGEVLVTRLAALGHADSYVREVAARNLGELGQASEEVVSALIGALNDSSVLVREAAVGSLGELGQASGAVVSALVAALGDSDWQVRKEAATSLVLLGEAPGDVMSALPPLMGDFSGFMSESAARILGELDMASDMAASTLAGELGDSNSDLKQAAASTLGQLKIEDEAQLRRVLVALNRRLHDRNDDVRRAALTAIRRLLDGRQIPGYRWVPIREQQRRARLRKRIGWAVLALGLVALALCMGGVANGQLDFSAAWVRVVGGLAGLASLAAGVELWLAHRRRLPWDR